MNRFISFEGIDGCGKTTQIKLLSKYLDDKKLDNTIVREPGSTNISEKIREILLNNNNKINPYTETLLFLSSRSQLVNEIITKNIDKKVFTLCDRFTDSTLAYQGYGRGLDKDMINVLNNFATLNIKPDLTFILDVNLSESIKRIGKNMDRMEKSGLEFLNNVRLGYKKISSIDTSRYKLINCLDRTIEDISDEIINCINKYYRMI